MYNIYKNIVQPILTNEIIVNWIAPIITGLLVVAIPIFLSKFIRNKNLLKNIQETNNKKIKLCHLDHIFNSVGSPTLNRDKNKDIKKTLDVSLFFIL